MPTAIIEIIDEVNARITGVPANIIRDAQSILTWPVPNHRYMEKFRAGYWDGNIKLMSDNGHTYLNLLDHIMPYFTKKGYEFELEDHRHDWSAIVDSLKMPDENIFSDCELDGKPIVLRDYQMEAVERALKEGSGILEMATGSGKTITCAALSKVYSKFGKVVVIVPSINLALQTRGVFQSCGLQTGIWYGELKEPDKITISTWQSLSKSPELMTDVICCIVDEAHQAKAKTLMEILSGPGCNVPFRFGCTGTMPLADLYKNQILAGIGRTLFELKAWELQERGVLASAEVYQFVMEDSRRFKKGKKHTFDDWLAQVKWCFSNEDRINSIAETIEVAAQDGNVLVLVEHKESGKRLQRAIKNSISIDGDDKGEVRKEEFEKFETNHGHILIATINTGGVGIDMPRVHALAIVEPGKSYERITQMMGRGLRKAKDKEHLTILDFSSDLHMSERQAGERRTLYKKAKITCEKIMVDY